MCQAVSLVLQQLLERAERPAGSRQQVCAQRTDFLLQLRLLPLQQQDGPVVWRMPQPLPGLLQAAGTTCMPAQASCPGTTWLCACTNLLASAGTTHSPLVPWLLLALTHLPVLYTSSPPLSTPSFSHQALNAAVASSSPTIVPSRSLTTITGGGLSGGRGVRAPCRTV